MTLLTWKNFHKEGQRKNKKAFRLFLQGGQQKRAKNINFFLFFAADWISRYIYLLRVGNCKKAVDRYQASYFVSTYSFTEKDLAFLLGKMKQSSPGHCVNLDLFGWRNTGIKIVFLVSLFEICS